MAERPCSPRSGTQGRRRRIEDLYLWAFSRKPSADEQKLVFDHVSAAANKQQAWEDVIWAMLNAKEFQFVR